MWQPKARPVSCITNLRTVIQPSEWKRQIADCQNSKDITQMCCSVPSVVVRTVMALTQEQVWTEKKELKFRFLTCTLGFACNLSTFLVDPLGPVCWGVNLFLSSFCGVSGCFNQLTIALNQVCLLFLELYQSFIRWAKLNIHYLSFTFSWCSYFQGLTLPDLLPNSPKYHLSVDFFQQFPHYLWLTRVLRPFSPYF